MEVSDKVSCTWNNLCRHFPRRLSVNVIIDWLTREHRANIADWRWTGHGSGGSLVLIGPLNWKAKKRRFGWHEEKTKDWSQEQIEQICSLPGGIGVCIVQLFLKQNKSILIPAFRAFPRQRNPITPHYPWHKSPSPGIIISWITRLL